MLDTLNDSIYMPFLEMAKLQREKADQWWHGIRSGNEGISRTYNIIELDCGDGCASV